ncbi:MAG: efflux RND transporter periplasmic adaptor subunit [Nitrospiraceae bacterium]
MRKGLLWVAGAVAIAASLGGYYFWGGEQQAAARYRTVPVERGSVISAITATGTVNPVVSVQVGSQVSGYIKSLSADYNSVVKAGQIVAQIDPSPFQARRDQAWSNLQMAKAAVSKANVDLAQKKREWERMKRLLGQNFVSQNDVDLAMTNAENAEAQLQLANAQVKQAEAALSVAELDLRYTTIRSPVDGIVIARNVEVGQTVAASFATPNFFLIALDLTQMQVDTNVSEADIGGMVEGRAATFSVDAYPGEVFHGQIKQVRNAPVAVQNVVTYNVVVGVENQDLRLKPGMTANVSIVVAQRDDALRVPNAALRFTPPAGAGGAGRADAAAPRAAGEAGAGGHGGAQGKRLWRLGAGGVPEPIPVQAGVSDGTVTEVIGSGLQEGDRVVIGMDMGRGVKKAGGNELPPGFGGGQRRNRDRGL